MQDLTLLGGFETARSLASSSPGSLPGLIREYRLTHEMLPTEVLGRADVWQALLENMPLGAVVRNLGRMTANGALGQGSTQVRQVVNLLNDETRVRNARLHPLNLVEAARIYAQGKGERGSLTWSPIRAITDALDVAIEHSFGALETSGKRVLIGVDTSGSMNAQVNGIKAPMSCKEAAAIMALATVKSHPEATVVGFHTEKFPLDISSRDRFSTAVRTVNNAPSGGTDCALPILYALENGMEVDAFIILSDEETWAGRMHPVQALREYRRLTGIPAKLIAVAMAPAGYSVADPNDAGSLLCVGLDTSVPQVIKAFLSD